jgi:hypothetical protein
MALPPSHDHRISLEAARALTKRYRETAGPGAQLAGMFPTDVFKQLIEQPGCMGIRIYYGETAAGTRELVLVGVDASGNDMTSATLFDAGFPCPPYCGGGGGLSGG